MELQAAVLARRATYSDAGTVTTARCTDGDFAAAFTALQAVGLELDRLVTRVAENMRRNLSYFDM